MEYFIEYLFYFIFVLLIFLERVYIFNRIKKPKNKAEFAGAVLLLLALTVFAKTIFTKTFGDEFLLTHTFSKIINLYVNP